jgi:starch synthase
MPAIHDGMLHSEFREGRMSPQNSIRVAMFTAEAFPYAKVGGLGDVLGSLPKKLDKLGIGITLMLPAYKAIHHDRFDIHPYRPLPGFDVQIGSGFSPAEIYHTKMPGTNVEVFLIGSPDYFLRDGIYDDPLTHEGYADNMERFIFFMRAGLDLLCKLGRPVDIIHCHDWQTGLIPGLIQTTLRDDPYFARVGTLLTIHNLAYQGVFPKESLYWAGIDHTNFTTMSPFEFWGKVNFLKAGIEFSDYLSTVSENYALEIQSGPLYGCGLEGVLKKNRNKLCGIVNGIDYEEWNPETDPLIPAHFSAKDLSGKSRCKNEILKYFGLPRQDGRTALVGLVSRLADQKGFDLIAEAIKDISRLQLQMVILGTGQQKYHQMLKQMARDYPEKLAPKLAFDNRLAHQIEAGCDMFLMPSKYEPCGLNQLYSLRYGAVPIVRATGGLVDTVVNYDGENTNGTGFSFVNYSSGEMVTALRRALKVYSNPLEWEKIMIRGMKQDWSWERSARKYLRLYEKIYGKKNGQNAREHGAS